jgi:hypothetical protein
MTNIVFMHIPRTGGGTFKDILEAWFGKENFYSERGGETERQLAGIQSGNPYVPVAQHSRVIHGHFAYHSSYKDKFLCTFIRNPVDWTISRWAYHMKFSNKPMSVTDLMDMGFVNIQSKYLKGSTLDDFNFIGITDRYIESMKVWESVAPKSEFARWQNVDWNKVMTHQKDTHEGNFKNASPRDFYTVTDKIKNMIKERNKEDFELYEKAKNRWYK